MRLATDYFPCLLLLSLALLASIQRSCGAIEEIQVYSPHVFNQLSLDYFLERRKADPTETMDGDSPLMLRAKAHAVRRLVTRADEELAIRDSLAIGMDGSSSGSSAKTGSVLLQLPQAEANTKDAVLSNALNAHAISNAPNGNTDTALVSDQGLSYANAVMFNEQVGGGAISRAGALPSGQQGEWLKLVEEKLKRDASLTHHGLLWELGAELAEAEAYAQQGVNATLEQELHTNLKEWFEAAGGKMHFVETRVNSDGIRAYATEDIAEDDVLASLPFRLIMCRQTARNVLIGKTGRYLGEELSKTFDHNEVWGLAIFLLHEFYKEVSGSGSKWGPLLRSLRMRYLSTEAVRALQGTVAGGLSNEWLQSSDKFMWWSVSEGPCVPTTRICTTKPLDRHGDTRFTIHQIRWAYWVVKQNAVRIRQVSTGLHFLALVPFFNAFSKALAPFHLPSDSGLSGGSGGRGGNGNGSEIVKPNATSSLSTALANANIKTSSSNSNNYTLTHANSGVRFELDGTITVRAASSFHSQEPVSVIPGAFTDAEFFMRFLSIPADATNGHNYIQLKLPGAVPKGSKFHFCLKGTRKERDRDECRGSYRAEAMFWKSKVLTEWRKQMNLPPRVQELRMWATRLHLYGTGEEAKLQSAANHIIAGLPISVEEMPAEEQLMLMGVAQSSDEASLMVQGNAATPQIYSAPDPSEDPEAERAMQELAYLAAQAQHSISHLNPAIAPTNATQAVLNRTRDFFLHGILPTAGLDEVDDFLLKKIGMVAHCGYENDMKITYQGVSQELFCAMRVHMLNETETAVFCPATARAWQDNCHDVHFANFTAISHTNEASVIKAFRASIHSLLAVFPTTLEEDEQLLSANDNRFGTIMTAAVRLRMREKQLLSVALGFIDAHEAAMDRGEVPFQLEEKAEERRESDKREEERERKMTLVRSLADEASLLATVSVDFGPQSSTDSNPAADTDAGTINKNRLVNLTLSAGQDVARTVEAFCATHSLPLSNANNLASALKAKVAQLPAQTLTLTLGVITPKGERKVLAIREGADVEMETEVFCHRQNLTVSQCDGLRERVSTRLNSNNVVESTSSSANSNSSSNSSSSSTSTFIANVNANSVLAVLGVDAPDSRKLQLVLRQGEQHDLPQTAADFLEAYGITPDSANTHTLARALEKRLPQTLLSVPVGLQGRRGVSVRFCEGDNVTAVVDGFMRVFELASDESLRVEILKRARYGLAPGSFIV